VINDMKMQVISVGLFRLSRVGGEDFNAYGPLYAGYVIASVPLVLLFIALGKWYVEGLVDSGLKV